ncbi:MAG TPA: MFS transporter [Candidatus Acidoferrales bacterium]|nr:MFS transporter [Candidatus Acidoferrales bacterium]
MSFSQRLQEIRHGFDSAFWVANVTELFERLSYYGVYAVLAIYLHEALGLTEARAGDLIGFFGGVVWFLPIIGGALADRFGFRRSLAFAYLVLALGYFLLGSLGSWWMAPLRGRLPLDRLLLLILMIPALGPAIVKPCIVGTTARASNESVRSIGYSIYYTLVNIGGTLGPFMAFLVRRMIGIENVFRVAAVSVFLMFLAILLLFREPAPPGEQQVSSIAQAIKNFSLVLRNSRFMLFLVIFSGFWVVFWQEFIALPLYVRGYIDPTADIDLILITDGATVITLQLVLSYLTRKIPPFPAMTLGLLISSCSWLILAFHPTLLGAVLALIVLALGEITQSPRFYEYVSRLAPSGQQGTYMGFAFLPIAIGNLIAGVIGGRLVHHFGAVQRQPQRVWWAISAIGFATTLLMWVYNLLVKPGQAGSRGD